MRDTVRRYGRGLAWPAAAMALALTVAGCGSSVNGVDQAGKTQLALDLYGCPDLSGTYAFPPPGAKGVFLVKPQFEAGREAIGKGGLLKDPEEGPRIAERLRAWLETVPGWRALGLCRSPVAGGDGNREFLLAGAKDR